MQIRVSVVAVVPFFSFPEISAPIIAAKAEGFEPITGTITRDIISRYINTGDNGRLSPPAAPVSAQVTLNLRLPSKKVREPRP